MLGKLDEGLQKYEIRPYASYKNQLKLDQGSKPLRSGIIKLLKENIRETHLQKVVLLQELMANLSLSAAKKQNLGPLS